MHLNTFLYVSTLHHQVSMFVCPIVRATSPICLRHRPASAWHVRINPTMLIHSVSNQRSKHMIEAGANCMAANRSAVTGWPHASLSRLRC